MSLGSISISLQKPRMLLSVRGSTKPIRFLPSDSKVPGAIKWIDHRTIAPQNLIDKLTVARGRPFSPMGWFSGLSYCVSLSSWSHAQESLAWFITPARLFRHSIRRWDSAIVILMAFLPRHPTPQATANPLRGHSRFLGSAGGKVASVNERLATTQSLQMSSVMAFSSASLKIRW
jgi:hypothetical protein